MNIKERKLQNSTVELEITVPVETINVEFENVIKNLQKTAKIDGFRAGKAPLDMVKAKYEKNANDKVLDSLIRNTYFKALEEKKFHPISQPKIDFDDFDMEKEFKYKAVFEIYPTCTLKDYKNVSVEEKQYKITDDDVNFEIEALREKQAEVSDKEEDDIIKKGDQVTIKVKRTDLKDDDKAPEQQFSSMNVIAGKSDKDHEFDKYVIGLKKGDEKSVKFKYPKDFHIEDLANEKVEYLIQIDDAKNRKLPKVDDEFAKDVSDFDTLAQLKDKTKKDLDSYAAQKVKSDVKADILKKIIEKSEYDLPLSMIESEKKSIFSRMQQRLGFQLDDRNIFAQAMGMKAEDFEQKLEDEAAQSIKTSLTLSEISNVEKLEVNDDDYKKAVEEMAERNKKSYDDMIKMINENKAESNIKSELIFDKALEFIYNNAKVKTLSAVSFKELMGTK